MLSCVCSVLGHLAPVVQCAPSVLCDVCAVSSDTGLLFTGVPSRYVVFCVLCPGPLGSCSPMCPLRGLCRVSAVLGHLAPDHRCAPWEGCVAYAVSWAWCSLVCWLGALCCVCSVLSLLAPVQRCVGSVPCVVCALSWAAWVLFAGVPALCAVSHVQGPGHLAPVHQCACVVHCVARVRCPGSLGSCSPLCSFGAL